MIKKLWWPQRFPRLYRFPRFRKSKAVNTCICGMAPHLHYSEKGEWQSFCSGECHDLYLVLTGRESYHWKAKKFDEIKSGMKSGRFYIIKRFPRLRRKK